MRNPTNKNRHIKSSEISLDRLAQLNQHIAHKNQQHMDQLKGLIAQEENLKTQLTEQLTLQAEALGLCVVNTAQEGTTGNIEPTLIGMHLQEDNYHRAELAQKSLRLLKDMTGAINAPVFTVNPDELHSMLSLLDDSLSQGLDAAEWGRYKAVAPCPSYKAEFKNIA